MELKNQASEHKRVLDTLNGVPEDRKAFRLIGGVLVERTVAEVKPAVEANRVQIEEVVQKLTADLDAKRSRFASLQVSSAHGFGRMEPDIVDCVNCSCVNFSC